MRDIEVILRDAEKRATLLFDKTPRAPVVDQPFPRFRESQCCGKLFHAAHRRFASRGLSISASQRMDDKVGLRSVVYLPASRRCRCRRPQGAR
jgi:hypothetical protein